jgi:hypothetical protein
MICFCITGSESGFFHSVSKEKRGRMCDLRKEDVEMHSSESFQRIHVSLEFKWHSLAVPLADRSVCLFQQREATQDGGPDSGL